MSTVWKWKGNTKHSLQVFIPVRPLDQCNNGALENHEILWAQTSSTSSSPAHSCQWQCHPPDWLAVAGKAGEVCPLPTPLLSELKWLWNSWRLQITPQSLFWSKTLTNMHAQRRYIDWLAGVVDFLPSPFSTTLSTMDHFLFLGQDGMGPNCNKGSGLQRESWGLTFHPELE